MPIIFSHLFLINTFLGEKKALRRALEGYIEGDYG
jgi:hypothetical protein